MVGDDEVCAPLQGFVNNSGDRVHGEENFLHFLPGIPHHETHRIAGLRGARRIAPLEAPNYISQGYSLHALMLSGTQANRVRPPMAARLMRSDSACKLPRVVRPFGRPAPPNLI